MSSAAFAHAGFGGPASPKAKVVFELFGLPITNSILTTWVISILLIVAVRLMVGKMSLIPSKGQAIVESILEGIKGVIEPIVGRKVAGPVFPLLIGFFIFILISNWSGMIPGVGTVGHWEAKQAVTASEAAAYEATGGHVIERDGKFYKAELAYYVRPATSDLNTTVALAMIAFIAWFYFVLRYAGGRALVFDLFGNKADKKELPLAMFMVLGVIFILVGCIEVISIIFRPVSLSFRLYGNVFGGENLLSNMHGMFAYLLPVPFYFLEILIGLIQAFVFTLLVAVYIGLITSHSDDDHESAH